MLKAIFEKVKYWAYYTTYFLLIPVSIVRIYVKLFLKPRPVTRTLRNARFLSNGHVAGQSSLQDGTATDACGFFLMDLTIEKGE